MAPTYSSSRRSLDALDACTGACNLGLIIGCAAPIFIAISTLSIILVRRRIVARRSMVQAQEQEDEAISNGGSSFGMLYSRLSSIHPSRQSALVEVPQTPPGIQVETSSVKSISTLLPVKVHENIQEERISEENPNPEERPITPLLVLPSLSSMLGDFLSYGEAIDEQAPSESDVPKPKLSEGRSRPSLPGTDGLRTEEDLRSTKSNEGVSLARESSNDHLIAYMATSTTPMKSTPLSKWNIEAIEEEADPFAPMDVDDLVELMQPDIQTLPIIQSKPDLAVTTTLWSILVDSNSTLETLLPIRLNDFPSIPQVGLAHPRPEATEGVTASQSSLVLAFSRSTSAPASINLLADSVEDISRRFRLSSRRIFHSSRHCDPGQLWDEEDERRFSKAVVKGTPSRHTWSAGVSYSRSSSSGPGELWDDEDERRISCEVSGPIADEYLEALSTFATLSFASLDIISVPAGLGELHKSFRNSSEVPLALDSVDGDTTIGSSSESLESSRSTNVLLPHKNPGADAKSSLMFSSYSGGLCICQEIFVDSACVCESDISGGATIVELDDDDEENEASLKPDTSFGYQGVGFIPDQSQIFLSLDDNDVKSQSTSPATTVSPTASPNTRNSLASFAGLLEFDFDFETTDKYYSDDHQIPVVDMDIEPNSFYLSAICFTRIQWPWDP
ncbi:hypothetical protein SCHPADRAFT_580431 [Schizopora paradoxa]|uniref:Uncharacterized protein n=1 Tax=Schizopora paradoxa TaxID=27342 RepID=A0A0H2RC71_9AGAM|nr:hypothetical protein SCHPADRAFT_580431 [Schizopora paradoxa]